MPIFEISSVNGCLFSWGAYFHGVLINACKQSVAEECVHVHNNENLQLVFFTLSLSRLLVPETSSYFSSVFLEAAEHILARPFNSSPDSPHSFGCRSCWSCNSTLRRETHTSLVLVPPGCTSLVQPLDVCFNKEFKSIIQRLQNEHMHGNLDKYINGTIPAGQRRILITKWVGAAWAEMNQKRDTAIRGFEKCGISVRIDGRSDDLISIRGLENYQVRPEEESSEHEATESDENLFDMDSSDDEDL